MTSRERILNKLRANRPKFDTHPTPETRRHMVTVDASTPDKLLERFVSEAEALGCKVYQVGPSDAVEQIVELIGEGNSAIGWDAHHIPLPDLYPALDAAQITIAAHDDPHALYGITGVEAGLAGTGSIVVSSGPGKPRTASLLPDHHIAVLTASQIVADLETWFDRQRAAGLDAFREASNTIVISGASKTADIAQILVNGAHGPRTVHLYILP